MRFKHRMNVLFANWSFLKSYHKCKCSKLFICILSSQAIDLGVGESLRFWEMKLFIRTSREILFWILHSIAKSKMQIRISQSNATLKFVPEEARLLIADEDDQFFFRSDGSCRFVKTSTARILSLLSSAL